MDRMRRKATWGFLAAGALAALMIACGGSSTTPTPTTPSPAPTPAPTPSPTPNPGGGSFVFTITNNTVSPKTLTVPRGSQVTFVNNDNKNHDMQSDPHPEHTNCPEIGQAGFLVPGQSRQTGNLNTAKTCGFHDHELFSVVGLQGTIIVQ